MSNTIEKVSLQMALTGGIGFANDRLKEGYDDHDTGYWKGYRDACKYIQKCMLPIEQEQAEHE